MVLFLVLSKFFSKILFENGYDVRKRKRKFYVQLLNLRAFTLAAIFLIVGIDVGTNLLVLFRFRLNFLNQILFGIASNVSKCNVILTVSRLRNI